MARVRLLTDVPEGRSGVEAVVSARRAQELVDRGQAERVIVRDPFIERAAVERVLQSVKADDIRIDTRYTRSAVQIERS